MKKVKKIYNFNLRTEVYKRLKEYCKTNKISMSAFVDITIDKKLKKPKYISLPLKGSRVCGHAMVLKALGTEEKMLSVKGINGIYVRPYIDHGCEDCFNREMEEMKKEVKSIEKGES